MSKMDTQKAKTEEQTGECCGKVDLGKKGTDFTGALLLITAGCVLLLNNFGILSWDVWDMVWRFWPLFLILLGLQLVFGKRGLGRMIVTIIGIILIVLVFVVSIASVNPVLREWLNREFPVFQQIRVPSDYSDRFNVNLD